MLKVGVIGIGSMEKNHMRAYSEFEDVERVGAEDMVNSLRNDPSIPMRNMHFPGSGVGAPGGTACQRIKDVEMEDGNGFSRRRRGNE